MFVIIKNFFKTSPEGLAKELDDANRVFYQAIERLKKIRLKATRRMVRNNGRISKYRMENDKLERFSSRVDLQVGRYRGLVD